jgi:predicted ester cyclase
MSTEENKAIVRRYMEQVWNKGDPAVADELVDPRFNEIHPERSGPEGEKHFSAFYRTTFPGFRFTIEDMIAEGDRVVVQWIVSGTHGGEFMGVAATGKPFEADGISIYRLSGGKIVGNRHSVWDRLSLFQQVGAFPEIEPSS